MRKKKSHSTFKRILSCLLVSAVMLGTIPAGVSVNTFTANADESSTSTTDVDKAALDNNLTTEIEDGAILHCWCWSFDTIKDNMKDIAAAGFSTIQTSPANECKDTYQTMKIMGSDTSGGTDGVWWWHYQPTDWKIGNYQLGTKDDFKAMCEEADKYGIKVIVDVIPNHTTPDLGKVSQNLIDAAGGSDKLYHANGFNEISNYGDRTECTTGQMGGLPDVDTENPAFQAYFLTYLNDLIACGADGFRYDTAKHIGVPSDPLDTKSANYTTYPNFWPIATGEESVTVDGVEYTLSNAGEIFNYGEVLQGSNVPEAEYAKYMYQTASTYGSTLRSAVTSQNFSVSNMSSFQHSSKDLVTWVESHDTYCNAGESVGLTFTQIRLAWAAIAARKDGTPLFYSRPDGSNGWSNRWGNNVLGAKGNDEFKSDEVTAVNFFRNAMAGEDETLRNPNNNTQILQIDRGTVGSCIINTGSAATLNGVETSLEDGTYTDQVSGGTFTVSDGKLIGSLNAESVAVIYNADAATLKAKTEGGNTEFSTDSINVTLVAKNVTNATYTTSEGKSGSFVNGDVITIGSSIAVGETVTVTLKGQDDEGKSVTELFTFTKVEKNIAYINLPSGWDAPYCYAYSSIDATEDYPWPGKLMTSVGNGVYKYEVPDNIQDPLVIFYGGDNTRRYPADMEDGLSLTGSMIYTNSTWIDYDESDTDTDSDESSWTDLVDGSYDVYCYKPTGWGSTVYCYAYESETSNNATWPGALMTSLGQNVYAYNLPDTWTTAKVMFTDNNNQYPAANQPGLDCTNGTPMLYNNGSWTEVVLTPKVEASLSNGSTFDSETTTVKLTLKNATSGTYVLDDGEAVTFTDSVDVVIGKGKIADTDIIIKTTATNGTDTKEETFTYTKNFNAEKNGGSVQYTNTNEESQEMTVNFGADRSSPQNNTTDLILAADVTGGVTPLTYNFKIDGQTVQNSDLASYTWDTTCGTHEISVTVTDSENHTVTVTKEYVVTHNSTHGAFAEPSWVWLKTSTGYDVTAKFACEDSCVESISANVTTSTNESGNTVYDATVEFNGQTYNAPSKEITTHSVTVEGGSITAGGKDSYSYGDKVTVTANVAPAGKVFSGWQDGNGVMVSNKSEYTFVVYSNTTLTAIYTEDESEVSTGAFVSIQTTDRTKLTNGTGYEKVSLIVQWSLPSDCKCVEAGILRKYIDADQVSTFDKDSLSLENKADDTAIRQNIAPIKPRNGTYKLNITMGTTSKVKTLAAVGYLKYTNSNGEERIMYTSNMVQSAYESASASE